MVYFGRKREKGVGLQIEPEVASDPESAHLAPVPGKRFKNGCP